MARKRPPAKGKRVGRKKSTSKKAPGRGGRAAARRRGSKRPARIRAKGATPRRRKAARKKKPAPRTRPLSLTELEFDAPEANRGLGAEAGGQAGDIEGLSRAEIADSESVEELIEEGQAFEAGVVEGVENVPDADRGEIRTREVPEDDVPQEYLDED
jgi:hypothetical protein